MRNKEIQKEKMERERKRKREKVGMRFFSPHLSMWRISALGPLFLNLDVVTSPEDKNTHIYTQKG